MKVQCPNCRVWVRLDLKKGTLVQHVTKFNAPCRLAGQAPGDVPESG